MEEGESRWWMGEEVRGIRKVFVRGSEGGLEGVEERETVIRIYFVRKILILTKNPQII